MFDKFSKLVAEFIGTFTLVFGGCGSALIACAGNNGIGYLGVSLAFGLTVLTMIYAVGHISGGHFNPAVTIGLAAAGKFCNIPSIIGYIFVQIIGGVAAAACLYLIVTGNSSFDITQGFATTGFGEHSPEKYSFVACAISEIIHTGIFLLVFCSSTDKLAHLGFAPLAIGLCLTLIHLISIPITNTSVNPARSTAVAIFQGGWAIEQLWFFWTMPIIGAILGGLIYRIFLKSSNIQ